VEFEVLLVVLENTAGCPADDDTSGTPLRVSAPLMMVKGVACAGSVMLQSICVAPSTSTAPQYFPVASENSVTVEPSVTGAAGSMALVMVKAVAVLSTVVVEPGVPGGGDGAGRSPGARGGGGGVVSALATLAVLTVVSTPLMTASVVPVGEENEV
jgi:hypothetical protein